MLFILVGPVMWQGLLFRPAKPLSVGLLSSCRNRTDACFVHYRLYILGASTPVPCLPRYTHSPDIRTNHWAGVREAERGESDADRGPRALRCTSCPPSASTTGSTAAS